jgi:tRNA pseudouridine synthase 10
MIKGLTDKEIINTAKRINSKYNLCNACLGRFFAKIDHNLTNNERGEILKKNLVKTKKIKSEDCWLCDGLLNEIPHFITLINEALKNYEYETFLIGSKIDGEILEKEQEIIDYSKTSYFESIKSEINRETGKILEKKLGKEVDFNKPDIMAVIDTSYDTVNLQIASLFIYGRYKKFSREIPQTKWFCKICRGKGCKKCGYTGKIYSSSVEELVADKILEKTKGTGESFHGCGREDIDVLMLGNGRPFIIEIENPRCRNIDLEGLQKEINRSNKDTIEISDLRFSNRDEVVRIKNATFKKIYRVTLECSEPINNEKLKKAIYSLQGDVISQFTPSRVAHRRANLVRKKHIYNCKLEQIDEARATFKIETESGTYIKELVSGDDGKTRPSISEKIGTPCKVTELDVIKIKGE